MPRNDFKQKLAHPDGIIWDLDNTLYRFNQDFVQACHIAAARAALKNGAPHTMEEAKAHCIEGFATYGNSFQVYVNQHGFDEKTMHADFHDFLDETIIQKSLELTVLFRQAALRNVIVTHASKNWAQRMLAHLGLKEHFPDNRIVAAEDVDFQSKAASPAPFKQALDLLDLPPNRIAVVEDSVQNLRIPHEMGMTTILLHYGQPPVPMPDYVHADYNNAADFLKTLTGRKAAP